LNARDSITAAIALCLFSSPAIGIGGAFHICQRRSVDCLNGWTAAGSGALAAAGLGAAILAKLDDDPQAETLRPTEPQQGRTPNP
jgi:hypothetical protein